MKLDELSNSDILFLYFSNRANLDRYMSIMETKQYRSVVEIFDLGEIIINHSLTEEEIDEIKESDHFKYTVSIDDKLHLVADLISETNPDLYNKIDEAVNNVKLS